MSGSRSARQRVAWIDERRAGEPFMWTPLMSPSSSGGNVWATRVRAPHVACKRKRRQASRRRPQRTKGVVRRELARRASDQVSGVRQTSLTSMPSVRDRITVPAQAPAFPPAWSRLARGRVTRPLNRRRPAPDHLDRRSARRSHPRERDRHHDSPGPTRTGGASGSRAHTREPSPRGAASTCRRHLDPLAHSDGRLRRGLEHSCLAPRSAGPTWFIPAGEAGSSRRVRPSPAHRGFLTVRPMLTPIVTEIRRLSAHCPTSASHEARGSLRLRSVTHRDSESLGVRNRPLAPTEVRSRDLAAA